ncbi:methyl-accepting chemotaxis protein [Photobacterium sanguinicancri]|uniref:methyl-accepting chemotaxis protein n=1 Tax=Photobacterium sanguinicancri TaxID=875932 RepID=UPI0021C35092|nr:methyl-accepting chemotaxis protein [Photobacterium sanguinicancri]
MKLSLKKKFISASLAAVVIMATALTWLASDQLYNETRNGVISRAYSLTNAASNTVREWVNIRGSITKAFSPYINSTNPTPFLQQAKQAGDFEDIYFSDSNGKVYGSISDRNYSAYDPRERPWYKGAAAEGKQTITSAYRDAMSGSLMVTITEPVYKNGRLVGVIGSDVLIDQLIDEVVNLDAGKNAYAMLLDNRDGTFLAHPNKNLLLKPISQYNSEFNQSSIKKAIQDKSIETLNIDGDDKLIYFIQVPNTTWTLGVEMDRNTEEASLTSSLRQLIIVSILITLAVVAAVTFLVNFLFRDLDHVSVALAEIASGEGDLTQRLEPRSDDEVGQLALNFNRFVGNMHQMVLRLRDVSDSLGEQARTTASQAEERSTRIQHQQDEINMVATAINEMAAATQEIAGNADNTAQTSGETVSAAEHGSEQVTQSQQSISSLAGEVETATGVIGELNTHAQSINTILSTIQGIAEQTNLLALNAAIEAARAGEQGRGFAVVADEVRVLSQRTHASTQEIQQMIETLQQTTGRAVGIMENSRHLAETSVDDANAASASLSQINNAVTNISDMATQIASAAEEQSSVTEEITRNTQGIRDVSDELALEADEAARQAAELSQLSHELQQEINRFKL